MKRNRNGTYLTVDYTLEDENEYNDYDVHELRIEARVEEGEGPTWGYYGGSPGSPDEIEIETVRELVPVIGPMTLRRHELCERGLIRRGLPFEIREVPWEGREIKESEIADLVMQELANIAQDAAIEAACDRRERY